MNQKKSRKAAKNKRMRWIRIRERERDGERGREGGREREGREGDKESER